MSVSSRLDRDFWQDYDSAADGRSRRTREPNEDVFLREARNLRPSVRLQCNDLETRKQLEILRDALLVESEFTSEIANRLCFLLSEGVDDRVVSVVELVCDILASDDREVAVAGVSERAVEANPPFLGASLTGRVDLTGGVSGYVVVFAHLSTF